MAADHPGTVPRDRLARAVRHFDQQPAFGERPPAPEDALARAAGDAALWGGLSRLLVAEEEAEACAHLIAWADAHLLDAASAAAMVGLAGAARYDEAAAGAVAAGAVDPARRNHFEEPEWVFWGLARNVMKREDALAPGAKAARAGYGSGDSFEAFLRRAHAQLAAAAAEAKNATSKKRRAAEPPASRPALEAQKPPPVSKAAAPPPKPAPASSPPPAPSASKAAPKQTPVKTTAGDPDPKRRAAPPQSAPEPPQPTPRPAPAQARSAATLRGRLLEDWGFSPATPPVAPAPPADEDDWGSDPFMRRVAKVCTADRRS